MHLHLVQNTDSSHSNDVASNDDQETLDEKLERLTDKAKEVMDELEQQFDATSLNDFWTKAS